MGTSANPLDAEQAQDDTCMLCGGIIPNHDPKCDYYQVQDVEFKAPPSGKPEAMKTKASESSPENLEKLLHEENAPAETKNPAKPPEAQPPVAKPAPKAPARPPVARPPEARPPEADPPGSALAGPTPEELVDIRQAIATGIVKESYYYLTVNGRLTLARVFQVLSNKFLPASPKDEKLKTAVTTQAQNFRKMLVEGLKKEMKSFGLKGPQARGMLMEIVRHMNTDLAELEQADPGALKLLRSIFVKEVLTPDETKKL